MPSEYDLSVMPSFETIQRNVETFYSVFDSKREAGLSILHRLAAELEVLGMPFSTPLQYSVYVSEKFFEDRNISLEAMLYSNLVQNSYPIKNVFVTRDLTLVGLLNVEFVFG